MILFVSIFKKTAVKKFIYFSIQLYAKDLVIDKIKDGSRHVLFSTLEFSLFFKLIYNFRLYNSLPYI